MRVLVIGGMHGNEPLGIEVVKLLEQDPIANVDTLLANPNAIAGNVRFTGSDLNRAFPGDSSSNKYEQLRAAEIIEACQGYEVVIDFHNTHCSGNDCVFVGETAVQTLYDVASEFGLQRAIVADYNCLNKYASNCISVEISLDSPLMNAGLWATRITELASVIKLKEATNIQKYQFVYRMTLEDKGRLELDSRGLEAFRALSQTVATELGVVSPAYPIFVGDKYTPYNYGGILNKINV